MRSCRRQPPPSPKESPLPSRGAYRFLTEVENERGRLDPRVEDVALSPEHPLHRALPSILRPRRVHRPPTPAQAVPLEQNAARRLDVLPASADEQRRHFYLLEGFIRHPAHRLPGFR